MSEVKILIQFNAGDLKFIINRESSKEEVNEILKLIGALRILTKQLEEKIIKRIGIQNG